MWKQHTKVVAYTEQRLASRLEEVFEGWKHVVAFKGGHSIHNKALKRKVFSVLIKQKKLAKVKWFMKQRAHAQYAQSLLRHAFAYLVEGVAVASERKV